MRLIEKHTAATITKELDVPRGHLYVEDKITMMQRVQAMQLCNKQNNLSAYSGADFDKLLKELADDCVLELIALRDVSTNVGER
jgi:hypothetical protein